MRQFAIAFGFLCVLKFGQYSENSRGSRNNAASCGPSSLVKRIVRMEGAITWHRELDGTNQVIYYLNHIPRYFSASLLYSCYPKQVVVSMAGSLPDRLSALLRQPLEPKSRVVYLKKEL